MATIIRFPRRHARASSAREVSGRTTSDGQAASSGQRSENQAITSSYLRAVKVLPSSSKRSKKRQSPAAKRPMVDKLIDRASAYADAQASKLDLNSVSMVVDDSRKIPTTQAKSVGKFRLAESGHLSDKSAMSTPDEVRSRLLKAFETSERGPIALAEDWGLERNYIREFLIEKKNSLDHEVVEALSEYFRIPIEHLTIRKMRKKRKSAAA